MMKILPFTLKEEIPIHNRLKGLIFTILVLAFTSSSVFSEPTDRYIKFHDYSTDCRTPEKMLYGYEQGTSNKRVDMEMLFPCPNVIKNAAMFQVDCFSNIELSGNYFLWQYNPFERTYSERILGEDEINALEWIRQTDPGHTTPELIGEETINGHPCEIYRYIDKNFNQPVKEWRSKQHSNLPLKRETGNPIYEIAEVLEFSFDKIDNDVFLYPEGYQKVTAINPSFLIDYHYYPMIIDYPFIPAMDMKNISIGKDPTTGEVYGDIWIRWFTPKNKISTKEAIPFKEFNESSVFTEHLLISKNKKMCRLSIINSDLKENELWRKDYARTWNEVSKNDVYDTIIEKVMDLINRNTDTQGHFSISFWGIK